MTQFLLVESALNASEEVPEGIRFRPLASDEHFLEQVARSYFDRVLECRLVTDPVGRTEPLVDAVWEAQQGRMDIHRVPLVQLMKRLVHQGVAFVCWSGSDFTDLPHAGSFPEVERLLLEQTAQQPADTYLYFRRRSLVTGIWGRVEGHEQLRRVRIDRNPGGGFLIVTDEATGTFDIWVESEEDALEFVTPLAIVWEPPSGSDSS